MFLRGVEPWLSVKAGDLLEDAAGAESLSPGTLSALGSLPFKAIVLLIIQKRPHRTAPSDQVESEDRNRAGHFKHEEA